MENLERITRQNINLNNMRKSAIRYIRQNGENSDVAEILDLLGDHPSLPGCCLAEDTYESIATYLAQETESRQLKTTC